jgi:hypothetical protein
MAKIYIGDILDWEQYTDKQTWEEKTAWTKVWGLVYNEEKDTYSVNFLGQWLNVFPKRDNVSKSQVKEDISISDLPF